MDRITELMDGTYGGRRQRNEARARFDWILSHLGDGPILDIGCSQGFLGTELAEKSIDCTGLDIDADAIGFANARKAELPHDQSAHLTYLHEDIMAYKGGKFADIVIGQVLEHVENPIAFLGKAGKHLRTGGKLLISVPYGRWDHDDHHHAFYLDDFREMIGKDWSTTEITLIGGRLCAVLKRKTKTLKSDPINWDKLEYEFFEAKEARYIETSADWRDRYNKAVSRSGKYKTAYKIEKERRQTAEASLNEFKSSKTFYIMRRLWQIIRIITHPSEIPIYYKQLLRRKYGRVEKKSLKAGRLRDALTAREASVKVGAELNSNMLRAQIDLMENGFIDAKASETRANYSPNSGHIAYVVHNSLPYSGAGYAVRTHGLVAALGKTGLNVHAVSRLGYPHDRKLANGDIPSQDFIDGVAYHRLIEQKHGYGRIPQTDYLANFVDRLEAHSRETRPALLHAASNYMNGIAANTVAKRLGIPSIYEVRGLWELTRISRQAEWENTEAWDLMVQMETQAAKGADRVLALTPALKDILIQRGVEAEKITVVSNAVDTSKFNPDTDQPAWNRPTSAISKKVIAYIGSLLDYEGVDDLITAFDQLEADSNTVLLIVGGGVLEEDLRKQAAAAKRSSDIHIVGRKPFEDIPRWYASADILVYPRKSLPVCEAVAPVKIFDAMAARRPILASNVRVLADIVEMSGAGQTFSKGEISSLVDALKDMTAEQTDLSDFANSGHTHVQTHSWERSAAHVLDAYKSVGIEPV